MERQTTAYEVKVITTNAIGNQFYIDGFYMSCKKGVVIVVTDYPSDIFKKWGETVISIQRMGPAIEMSTMLLTNPPT